MIEALKPCPFCGVADRLYLNPANNNPGHESWVSCRACDASGKMCIASAGKSAEQWATEFWNTRATPEPEASEEGWFIPLDCMSGIAVVTFRQMMEVIKTGGMVDVHAYKDGKKHIWQCDGLKYAKFTSKPKAGEVQERLSKLAEYADAHGESYIASELDALGEILCPIKPVSSAIVSFLESRAKRSSYSWSVGSQYNYEDWKNEGSIGCAQEALRAIEQESSK